MRIGKVIGTVTLSRCHPAFDGATLKMAVPMSLAELRGEVELGPDFLVVYDELGAGMGHDIAITEGAESSAPFRPELKPVGAYNSAILDRIELDE